MKKLVPKTTKAAKKPKPGKQPKTPNGRLIKNVMDSKEVKGDYKDFVLISGSKLIDTYGSWDIFTPEGTPMGVDGVVLHHKKQLHKMFGEKFASRFWNTKLDSRVPASQAESNKNAVRH